MADFSTEFSIDDRNTVADVIRLACRWVTGSPHSAISPSDLQQPLEEGEFVISKGNERVTVGFAKLPEHDIGGLHYVRTEGGLEWTTAIVALKSAERTLLSVQVVCEALNTAVSLPPPKKPYFVRQAIENLGGGADGEIPVADRPFRLDEDDVQVAAALILGTASNRLPIIYVSASLEGQYQVNPDELAKYVSGMAHVVVEPSRAFSFKLKDLTRARNVYGGTVGVYWPESDARKSYFLDDQWTTQRALQVEIAKDIRVALANRRQRGPCTWAHLKEAIARKRFEHLKSTGSKELQDYIAAFDEETAAKDARLIEAEQEIARLKADVKRLASREVQPGAGLIRPCAEQDLYEHEIAEIVIAALIEARRNVHEGSRRQHVLDALIGANPSTGASSRLEQEVKSLFRTYRDMDARTRSALSQLGFDLSEDGKHYKLVFQGDGRYTFTIPKTSSDHRAGKNIGSTIGNALF